jgi:hypothetical protein
MVEDFLHRRLLTGARESRESRVFHRPDPEPGLEQFRVLVPARVLLHPAHHRLHHQLQATGLKETGR